MQSSPLILVLGRCIHRLSMINTHHIGPKRPVRFARLHGDVRSSSFQGKNLILTMMFRLRLVDEIELFDWQHQIKSVGYKIGRDLHHVSQLAYR